MKNKLYMQLKIYVNMDCPKILKHITTLVSR
jgi:hypothetical protein